MVKIDAGGLEASIGQVDFANSALAVIQKMREAEYRLIDITDMNRIPNHGVVWRCEFVFLGTGSKLLDSAVRY